MLKYWLFLILFLPVSFRAQSSDNPQEAFATAAASGRPVLVIFQGSDWCIPCIKLDRKVLLAPEFLQYAGDRFVILKADFPQKKKVDAALEKQYEALAEAYNKEGSFPKMILLDADHKLLHTFRTDYTSASELISELEPLLKAQHAHP